MTQRSQNAYTRNHTLQRELERQCLNLRRSLRYTRRRNDTVEEECLASLYKLLLYAKDKQEDTKPGDSDETHVQNRPHSVFDRPKSSANDGMKRPATAMSAKSFTQSYSFVKNGMNIHQANRERYLRSKAEKEKAKQPIFKIERLETAKEKAKSLESRPMTTVPPTDDAEIDEIVERPKTAHAGVRNNRTPLTRPKITVTLPSNDDDSAAPTATNVTEMNPAPLDTLFGYRDDDKLTRIVKSISGRGRYLPPKNTLDAAHRPRSTQSEDRVSPTPDVDVDGENMDNRNTLRSESRISNVEDDLIPLSKTDQNKLDQLCVSKKETRSKSAILPSRSPTATPRAGQKAANDDNLLKQSSFKAQMFLTQYSKKSKLFGYVVKTRAPSLLARERVMSFRSPYISFQELASIKAGIKQHVSKTRSLVQRSAKLSTYVDKLATGSLQRKYIEDLKEAKLSRT